MLQHAQVSPHQPVLAGAELSVLHTLLYFDIFRHPLTTDEVHRNCQWHTAALSEIAVALEGLERKGLVSSANSYWFIAGSEHHVRTRIERNERALSMMKKAKRYASFISSFPFVRAVFISGSLSKGTLDHDGDIDYFIITKPGRLWVARTLLILFKKIFLLNSKKYFCVNYFIDTDNLLIPDRNLFVATEIAHLLPMRGASLHSEFRRKNHWTFLFYPNQQFSSVGPDECRNTAFKRWIERLWDGRIGDFLEKRSRKLTVARWKKKFPDVPEEVFENRFRSKHNVSKHHPNGFQQRVAEALEIRRKQLSDSSGVSIPALPWEWLTNDQA